MSSSSRTATPPRSSKASEKEHVEAKEKSARDDVLSASYHEIFDNEEEDEIEGHRTPVDPSFLTAKFVADTEKYGAQSPTEDATNVLVVDDNSSQLLSVDLRLLESLEKDARRLAGSLDSVIENISGSLHSISSLTSSTVEVYRDAVAETCDAMDAQVKTMYQLMARVEELNKAMAPVHTMAEELSAIRKTLDQLDLTHI